ncbi:MAG: hypothetical protein KC535_02400 [Nanoarchaeota archaeon]|nr:hypothetical protein [Nanoarchaeota archaeon]
MKSLKSYTKGQAALEFLTTYGWAFLVILVAIGGLSYFGVFDLGRVLPDGCKLDNSLECGSVFAIQTDGAATYRVDFEVRNGRDQQITIGDVSIIEKGLGESTTGGTPCVAPALGTTVNPDTFGSVSFTEADTAVDTCGIFENEGSKKTYQLLINYTVAGSTIPLQSNGELTTTPQ